MRRLWGRSPLAFNVTMLLAAGIFWIAPHPPMTDLPQHAAMLVMLKGMLSGTFPWAGMFQLNPYTPFLLGTVLALPLSTVLPVAASFKLLLSLAYIAFVTMAMKLGRQLKSDPRLDWIFLIGCFGFSYRWGFVTFMVAAPLALYFIVLAARHAEAPTHSRAARLAVVGILLLASHGLMFVFAWLVGFLMLGLSSAPFADRLRSAWGYAVLGLISLIVLMLHHLGSAGTESFVTSTIFPDLRLSRARDVLLFTVQPGDMYSDWPLVVVILLVGLLAPWLFGLRIAWRRPIQLAPLIVVGVILAVVPFEALNTFFLYQRFALFLPASYALIFEADSGQPAGPTSWLPSGTVTALLALVCWLAMGRTGLYAKRFGEETRDFDAVLAHLEPGRRALSLIFDRESAAAKNDMVYLHYPSWYQAERGGLVEFSFAAFAPQIVRYRPDQVPVIDTVLSHQPEDFRWSTHHGERYDYFFVRSRTALGENYFAGAACAPVLITRRGEWTVYERGICSAIR